MQRAIGLLGMLWGTVGVFGILLIAIYRLALRAAEAFEIGLTPAQWVAAALVVVAMAYMEGYRGFQLRFSPRTAARLRYLRDRPDPLRSALAPLFAMGYFHAKRRTRITAFLLTAMIVGLVTAVRLLDQPWRGIVDAGVVVGIGWGTLSLAWSLARVFGSPAAEFSPEVPETAPVGG